MKGVLFNHLRRYVEREHAELKWEDILSDCGIAQLLSDTWDYDDRTMECLIKSVARSLECSPGAVYYGMGKSSMAEFLKDQHWYFDEHSDARSFLCALGDIHASAATEMPGAKPPHIETSDDGETVTMRYESPRRMLGYLRGALDGILEIYGESARVELVEESEDHAVFTVSFA